MTPELVKQLSTCKSLPTIPAVATEIVRLCQTDDFTLVAMSELLARDAALTARLLRVANSALYSPRNPVKTVRVAVGILGSNAVMALALGFSLVKVKNDGASGFDYARFWRRSLLSAISARNLAVYAQLDREELFLAGMFQDIGMLVFDAAMPGYSDICQASEGDHLRLARLEREAYRADHTESRRMAGGAVEPAEVHSELHPREPQSAPREQRAEVRGVRGDVRVARRRVAGRRSVQRRR